MAATRILTINIRKYLVGKPRTKRRSSAVRFIRERIAHATKLNPVDVNLTPELNNSIIKHYSKAMVPLKINLSIDNGKVQASSFSEVKPQAKQAQEAKEAPANKKLDAKEKEQKQPEQKQAKQAPADAKKPADTKK